MNKLMILCILVALSGCATNRAKARSIDAQTNRTNEWHNLRLDEATAVSPDTIITKRYVTYSVGLFIVIMLTATAGCYAYFIFGMARTKVKASNNKAGLIYADSRTGLFPLVSVEVRGRHFLIDSNTECVYRLGKRPQESNPLALQGTKATQLAIAAKSNEGANQSYRAWLAGIKNEMPG